MVVAMMLVLDPVVALGARESSMLLGTSSSRGR